MSIPKHRQEKEDYAGLQKHANYGQRVQFSVFECNVDPAQWTKLRGKLVHEMDHKHDSLRFYFLGANRQNKIEHEGAKEPRDLEGLLIL